jgi:hypothetical protein
VLRLLVPSLCTSWKYPVVLLAHSAVLLFCRCKRAKSDFVSVLAGLRSLPDKVKPGGHQALPGGLCRQGLASCDGGQSARTQPPGEAQRLECLAL